jgi:hypothetical protein
MLVKKTKNKEDFKIILSRSEVDFAKKIGIPIEKYVKTQLVKIAKKRRWKWYFEREMQ